ncbi:MAG: DUF4265 domain-containing protein [Rhodocyclaceae bacterium]|nr:DUF4265 domain-containing protein [Rhodocyclaceae bacterium]
MASDIAVHPQPAWADRANFVIFADLEPFGMPGKWEQLWARQTAESAFELCCIPFFTYGLALGDEVVTRQKAEKSFVIHDCIRRSGHFTVRAWLGNLVDEEGRARVVTAVEKISIFSEWSSTNLLAIDASSETLKCALFNTLDVLSKELSFEIEIS